MVDTVNFEGGGELAVRANGVRVEFHANGSVDLYTDRPVALHPVGGAPQIGDEMPDGTKYAGVSPDTGKPMYAAASDAPLTMKWKQAMDYAAALDAHGHKDWRAPTTSELNVLFQNRAAIGNFNKPGQLRDGWYWSATEERGNVACAWAQRFPNGNRCWYLKDIPWSLRLVRG